MKKLIATLATILIAAALFTAVSSGPQFSLNDQVDDILFHGFTTNTYSNSDDLLAANDTDAWNAEKYSLNLACDDFQVIDHYAFYSTKLKQTSVSFVTALIDAE